MKQGKRWIALMLALAMCLSVLPANVLATELGSEAETTEVAAPEDTSETVEAEEPQMTETGEPDEEPVEDISLSTMAATSGKCGKNAKWSYNSKTKTLTISGKGAMYNYSWEEAPPWAGSNRVAYETRHIIVEEGVTKVGSHAFSGIVEMGLSGKERISRSISLPKSLTSIGAYAFDYYQFVNTITIPENVKSIGKNAFSRTGVKKFQVDSGNKYFTARQGVLFNKDKTILVAYPVCNGMKSYTIPSTVEHISGGAFDCGASGAVAIDDCELQKIIIPHSAETVDECVFCNIEDGEIYFEGSPPKGLAEAFLFAGVTIYYPKKYESSWQSVKNVLQKIPDWDSAFEWKTWIPQQTSKEFNAAIYRADYYLEEHSSVTENTNFSADGSPCKILYDAGREKGLANVVAAWKAVTGALDTIDKPSSAIDLMFEKKNMYSAIIFSIFQAESKNSHTILQGSDKAVQLSGKLFSYVKKAMKLKFNLDLTKTYDLSKMTKEQKQSLSLIANEWLEDQDSILKKISGKIDLAGDVIKYAKQFADWCDYVATCETLLSMNSYSKQIMSDMYQKATDADLKAALKDCVSIMDSTETEFYYAMLDKLADEAGKSAVKFGVDKCWSMLKKSAQKMNPYIAVLWKAYETSKGFCNGLLSTDKISEQYCKMGILVNTEDLLRSVYGDIKKSYNANKNVRNAKMLNRVVRLAYVCRKVDCKYADNFVETVDDAVISNLLYAFNSGNTKELRRQIDSIYVGTDNGYWDVNNGWIESLKKTYPDEYTKYKKWLGYVLRKCPIELSYKKCVYTGKGKKPSVTVSRNSLRLKEGTHYKVAYENNVEIGRAKVIVTGVGNYHGKITISFRIIPKEPTLVGVTNAKGKKLNIIWSKIDYVDGYEIQYALDSNFKNAKKKVAKKAKTVKKTIKGLKKGKKYYVRIRTYKKEKKTKLDYYSKWSKTKTVTIKK